MNPGWLGRERIVLEEVDSTSEELWRRAGDGAGHGCVVLAGVQSAGRGRQGRSWVAPLGNLLVSWLFRLDHPPQDPGLLSIAQGLALCVALDGLAPGRVQLKWPNDLMLDGLKVGGLLLEARSAGGFCVVSGFGLNLCTPAEGWGELEGRAIALDTAVADPRPTQLLDRLLPAVESAADAIFDGRGAELLADWPRWSSLDGRAVEWEDGGHYGAGTVRGLALDGGLRVVGSAGDETVLHAADVHLRGNS